MGARGNIPPAGDLHGALRFCLVVMLFLAPLAFGSVHPPAYVPLLIAAHVVGLLSWAKGHWDRAHGVPVAPVPATRLLAALHAVVWLQLVPLPPALLRLLSPGSFAHYNDALLLPLSAWRPISVSPADTLRGLLFLSGMSCIYATTVREFRSRGQQRLLAGSVVAAAFVATLVALLQAATGDTRIYGLWRPRWDWAVYGPYVNRNHFAGLLAMAAPLSLAFAAEALQELGHEWRRRRRGWLALGQPEASRLLLRAAEAIFLVAGLVSSRSRGAVAAFFAAGALFPFTQRRRRQVLGLLLLVATPVVLWVGAGDLLRGFETRGVRESRLVMWGDFVRLVPRFPVLGAGFNAFGSAYAPYQSVSRGVWWGEAHNEYLQVLIDTGVAGALLAALLVARLLRGAGRGARHGPLAAGLLVSLVAALLHNVVDFNWQIPANAATFAALAGAALVQSGRNGGKVGTSGPGRP